MAGNVGVMEEDRMLGKVDFPWEVPKFATEDEAAEWWADHEMTDEFISHLSASEVFEVHVGASIVHVTIVNILAVKQWNPDGTLISCEYDENTKASLQELKQRIIEGCNLYADKIGAGKKVTVDFRTRKVVRSGERRE
jgi:hypothetical protein